jgi:hypothetical protein
MMRALALALLSLLALAGVNAAQAQVCQVPWTFSNGPQYGIDANQINANFAALQKCLVPATLSSLGLVRPDGNTITVNGQGVISTVGGAAAGIPPNFIASNVGNFVQDTSPFRSTFPVIAGSFAAAVQGSTTVPDLTLDYTAVFQKIGTQSTNQEIGGAILGSLIATNTNASAHNTAIVGYAQSAVSVPSTVAAPFIEGVRGECNLIAPGQDTQCNGMSAEVNMWTPYAYAIGLEAAENNYTGTDPGTVLNGGSFDTAFLASCGDHGVVTGHKPCQTAFLVNPNSEDHFHYGLFISPGVDTLAVDTAAIEIISGAPAAIEIQGDPGTFMIHAPTSAVGGFNVLNDGSVDIGVYHPTGDAALRFYEAGGDHFHWDQAIEGEGGTAAGIGVASGSLLFETPLAVFTGSMNVTGIYEQNGNVGVFCTGTPSSSFAVFGGIVTHC